MLLLEYNDLKAMSDLLLVQQLSPIPLWVRSNDRLLLLFPTKLTKDTILYGLLRYLFYHVLNRYLHWLGNLHKCPNQCKGDLRDEFDTVHQLPQADSYCLGIWQLRRGDQAEGFGAKDFC